MKSNNKIIHDFMSANGKKGGTIGGAKTKKRYGRKHFVEIGRIGGKNRAKNRDLTGNTGLL